MTGNVCLVLVWIPEATSYDPGIIKYVCVGNTQIMIPGVSEFPVDHAPSMSAKNKGLLLSMMRMIEYLYEVLVQMKC